MKGRLALIGLVMLALPAVARADDWDQVVAAAKKEGVVNFYSASVGEPTEPLIAKAFAAKYGIQIHSLDARSSELAERIATEQTAGRFAGDVEWNGTSSIKQAGSKGFLQPFGSLPNLGKLVAPFKASDTIVPILINRYVILYNTELLKPEEAPKSWADLTDPKWKGKLLSDDMAALGGGSATFQVTLREIGREFHDKLAKNLPVFSRQQRDSEQRVARGEYPIYIPFNMGDMTILKGLPVKGITPTEGAVYVPFNVAMLKNAPHPNAARLLMDFYMSQEARGIIEGTGKGVTFSGTDEGVDPAVLPLGQGKLLGTNDDDARLESDLKLAASIYH